LGMALQVDVIRAGRPPFWPGSLSWEPEVGFYAHSDVTRVFTALRELHLLK